MADQSNIEWTDATWNPVAGCSLVSPGCTNCYAMWVAARLEAMGQATYAGLTKPSKAGPVWTGKIALVDSALEKPLRWRRPRRIFVNSMSDLFHADVPDAFIDKVFAVMALCPQHTFQVLTKRADRMRAHMSAWNQQRAIRIAEVAARMTKDGDATYSWMLQRPWPLPNVWLGVSVEDQARAVERIPLLLDTPAAVRWVSAEPLLGPVDLTGIHTMHFRGAENLHALKGYTRDFLGEEMGNVPRLDWVVVGGESGPDARPMHPDWARSLRNQCAAAGVPFFFKQWGQWRRERDWLEEKKLPDERYFGGDSVEAHGASFYGVGKKAAGRMLDGRTHDDYPQAPR